MFLVELVLQGIRGVQQARVRFQGGFNLVTAGNEAGKTTAADTILRLLYPVNQPEKMETLVSRATPDQSRGALVIFSDDSSYYQIIQDFSKKAVNLSKHDPATKKFALQFKDWNSTSQFMTGLLPGISEEDYGRLFIFRRDSCSGQSSPAPAASSSGASAPKGRTAVPAGRQSGQDAKLAELRETMRKAEEAAEKAGWAGPRTIGSAVASDAFFPFADGLLAAAKAGATAVIQPGGSIRDNEVIAAADEAGLAMVFTGMRHFRH